MSTWGKKLFFGKGESAKRIISVLLALALVFSSLPATAFAAEETPTPTVTVAPTPTPAVTDEPSPVPTESEPSDTPSATATAEPAPSSTPTPTATPTPAPSRQSGVLARAGEGENTPPILKDGINAAANARILVGAAYTLDLTTIFADADSDELTYTVKINEEDAVAADANYSYIPQAAGTGTLVFTANDGTADSTETYTVTLTVLDGYQSQITVNAGAGVGSISAAVVAVKDSNNQIVEASDGKYLLTGPAAYQVSLDGCFTAQGTITKEKPSVTVTMNLARQESSNIDWRGAMNRATGANTVDEKLPRSSSEGYEAWNIMVGAGSQAMGYYAGQPVIVDNYVYITGGGILYKVDKNTGAIVKQAAGGSSGNSYDYLAYGDGMVFVATSNYISAYNPDTLDLLWRTSVGGQRSLTVDGATNSAGTTGDFHPLVYHDGYIFCGKNAFSTRSFETDASGYNVPVWSISDDFNWNSGVFVGDIYYVSAAQTIYAVNYKTGQIIDRWRFSTNKNIFTWSGVAYSAETQRLYWSSYVGAKMNSVQLGSDGKFIVSSELSVTVSQNSLTTPLIYNGRVYMTGQAGNVDVLNASTLATIYVNATGKSLTGKIQSDPILSTAYISSDANKPGLVYIYYQAYTTPGAVYAMTDWNGNTTAQTISAVATPSVTGTIAYAYEQVATDNDGSLYFYNEAGYLFKFRVSTNILNSLSISQATQPMSFSSTIVNYNVPIVAGTSQVTVNYSAPAGTTVTVNGETAQNGTITVDVPETKKIVVSASSAGDPRTREYTILLHDADTDGTLSELKLSTSNTYNSSVLATTPAFSPSTTYYVQTVAQPSRDFINVWPTANNSKSSVVVTAGPGIQNAGTNISITATNQSHSRYAVYFAAGSNVGIVNITAKAEDGQTTKRYSVVLVKNADTTAPVISGAAVDNMTVTVTATDNNILAPEAYSFDGGLSWQASGTKTFAEATDLAAGTIRVKDAVGNTSQYGQEVIVGNRNHAPALKEGGAATATANTTVGTPYTLKLSDIFTDADTGDTLNYKVKIGAADPVAVPENYRYTPTDAGTYTLVFTANDGTVDSTDTYTITLTATAAGKVPALVDGVYQITNAAQLAWFRDLVNGNAQDADGNAVAKNAGANAVLTNDIDLSTVCGPMAGPGGTALSWTPIGTFYPTASKSAYTGDFDGHGFKLVHLYINTTVQYGGLFGYNTGTIRNLAIDQSGFLQTTQAYFGAIAAENTGKIYHCVNHADIHTSSGRAAGIASESASGGVISDCANTGNISTTLAGNGAYNAGIVATLGATTLQNCYNTGSISSSKGYIGGIIGQVSNSVYPTIINNYNAGNLIHPEGNTDVGGLVGNDLNATYWALSVIQNNYYLSTDDINTGLPAVGSGAEATLAQGRAVSTVSAMKTLALNLGSAYQADITPNINGGYPVLTWQVTGRLFMGLSAAPVITQDLNASAASYDVDEDAESLSVTANSPDDGTLTYQWYKSTTTVAAATSIPGATLANYKPSTSQEEHAQYYVVITNQSGQNDPTSIQSTPALIMVGTPEGAGIPAQVDGIYQIENAAQLAWFRDLVNGTGMPANTSANAILLNDINMSTVCGPTSGPEGSKLSWKPIGTNSTRYAGDFNGGGKKLTNLYINVGGAYQALFGGNNGTIRNLTIESGSVQTPNNNTAALAAINGGYIYNCVNKASISAPNSILGGLVANLNGGVIANSANMGSVTDTRDVSSQNDNLGGIAGTCTNSIILNCYNTGHIDSGTNNMVGGITGGISGNTIIQNCYNAGVVTGLVQTGGVIGYATAAIWSTALVSNNYSLSTDTINTGLPAMGAMGTYNGPPAVTDAQAKSVSDAELRGLSSTLGSAYAPDGTNMNGGYPVLGWQLSGTQVGMISARPAIGTNLATATVYYTRGAAPTVLSLAVNAPVDGGTLSYQWYTSRTAGNMGFTAIEGANAPSYTPSTADEGPAWYYVAVTNQKDTNVPSMTRSAVATIYVTDTLTVKFDDQVLNGTSSGTKSALQVITEAFGTTPAKAIKKFEIVSGSFLKADATYLFNTLVNSDSNNNVSVIFDDGVDISDAANNGGFSKQTNSKLFRLEIPGLKTFDIEGVQGTDTDANKLATLYIPDVETISGTGSSNSGSSFYSTNAITLYLPHLKTIGNYAFYTNGKLASIILPGDMPTVVNSNAFVSSNAGKLTVWVPAGKVDAYKNFADGAPADGMWYYCNVKALPAGITDLRGFVQWAVDQIPDNLSGIAPSDANAIYLARQLASALPLSLARGDMADAYQKAYASYTQLGVALVNDIEARIDALPAAADVTVADSDAINAVWNLYQNFDTAFKPNIPSTYYSNKLKPAYNALQDAWYSYYMANGTPFVSEDTLQDGTKRVNHGNTFAEFQYPDTSTASHATTYIGRGNFNSSDFFSNGGYRLNSSVTMSGDVTIDGGDLKTATASSSQYLYYIQSLTLPTVTRMEPHSILTQNYSTKWYLNLPNIVSMDTDAYFDLSKANNAAYYLPFMPKLESSKTILRADSPLMLPRLATGEKVFYATPQQYVFLPALTNAGANFFATATSLKAVWLPKAAQIDGGALAGSGVTELYLPATPPNVQNTGGLASAGATHTVYVPDSAAQAYKDAADGDGSDSTWYGWTIQPVSTSTTIANILNYYITSLPAGSNVTQDYTEFLGYLETAYESLTDAQKAAVNYTGLNAALAAVASFESQAITNVQNLITALGDPAAITLSQRAAVETVRAAYDALSIPAQTQVAGRGNLFAAEAALRPLIMGDLHDRIAAIPNPVTPADVASVRSIYSEYLSLTDNEKAQLSSADVDKLNAAVGQVVQIENDQYKAAAIVQRIGALPPAAQITLANAAEISNIRAAYNRSSDTIKSYVGTTALNTLAAAEAKITQLQSSPSGQKTVYVAAEKFTLGQGYVQKPIPVTITQDADPNVAAIVTSLIGQENYHNSGTISSNFYLRSVRDNDESAAVIPDYILNHISVAGDTVGGRHTQDWLGEFDYTSMSGWMYTVNSQMPDIGMADYSYNILQDGDVIRLQYSVYGYGADLGVDSLSASKYADVANKDELTCELAKVDASPLKQTWLQNTAYAASYAQAYSVIASMTSTQAQVDACVTALQNKPSTDNLGSVTVSVRDTALRRQNITTTVGLPMQYTNLSGLGNYQQPFGTIISNIEVPIAAGMNARDAVTAALESKGYDVTTTSGRITGIGPLTVPDRSATIQNLANGNAGSRSKWVLSLNGYAIADTESAASFNVRNGDTLSLDYSVDGGNDVHCFPYTDTYFNTSYSVDARLAGSGAAWDMYIPKATEQLAFTITRTGPPTAPDMYNGYHKFFIQSGDTSYVSGQNIPVQPGQRIQFVVRNPLSAGGSVYNSINNQPTGSGVDDTINLTVKYLKTPAEMADAIAALPVADQLDYDRDYDTIAELMQQYALYTQAEKVALTAISADAAATLQAASARMTDLYNADNQKVGEITALVNGYYGKITAANYTNYADAVNQSYQKYGELNSRTAEAFRNTVYYLRMMASLQLIDRYAAGDTSNIGIPTNYVDDFMINALAFNLDLGKPDTAYELSLMDSPRVGNQGYELPSYIHFNVKDPSVMEIREVPYNYTDNGLGGGGIQYPAVKYYLIPKKAGTTTFTATFDGFSGQTPEIVVHVNAPAEGGLANQLTNISTISQTRPTDTWYYWEGQEGSPFSFKVNGSEPKVYVYNYQSYGGTGTPNKTEYPIDANGNVTVTLKDGYNPIEVTATYNGQRVTQVYGLKGKVISYTIANGTSPGAPLKKGDTARLSIKGLASPVQKILRIFNPSVFQYWYDTNMPRYSWIKSGSNQYAATDMQFVLTGSGDVVLKNGRVFMDWFGNQLSDTDTQNGAGGGNAPQSQTFFSRLPDIHVQVADNSGYTPALIKPQVVEGTTVQAGQQLTITIPNLDTASLLSSEYNTGDNAILQAVTKFATDIPNCTVQSKAVTKTDEINDIKTIHITVPAGTPAGEYHIYGGAVALTYGISWWMKYTDCFATQIDDITLQVTPSDAQLQLALAKSDAKSELDAYASPGDYRTVQQTTLAMAIAAGKQAIDAAANTDAVAAALAAVKQTIDGIKTNAALTVEEKIAAIGTVTLEKEGLITQARQAYTALSDKQKALVSNYSALTNAEVTLADLKAAQANLGVQQTIEGAITWAKAGNQYLLNDTFLSQAGSTGGDWFPIGIGRYGYADRYGSYLQAIAANITSRYAAADKLDSTKATEWHRIALAVLAMDGDPTVIGTDPGGHPVNLVADGTYNSVVNPVNKQGINGAIWALIALDSKQYAVPAGAKYTRDDIIKLILPQQKADGGFTLAGSMSDPDITSMAVQALSTYYNTDKQYTYNLRGTNVTQTVRQVVNQCVDRLSQMQGADGDFGSAESIAQVIVALCSLGINPDTDTRFVKSGHSAIGGLMKYRSSDGGFRHNVSDTASNSMATEQSLYSLVAYWRYLNNMRNLYDFRPETDQSKFRVECAGQVYEIPFNPAVANYTLALPEDATQFSFTNIPAGPYDTCDAQIGAAIPVQDDSNIQVTITGRNGEIKTYTLQVQLTDMAAINDLISRINHLPATITLADKDTVDELMGIYNGLTSAAKAKVTNANVLLAAKSTIDTLEAQHEQEVLAEQQRIAKDVAELPRPVSLDDKGQVNNLLAELAGMDDFAAKAGLVTTLNSDLQQINAIQATVDQLDSDIWNKIQPKNITLAIANDVAGMMARYNALRVRDQAYVTYSTDLVLADKIITDLKKGIIDSTVFNLIMGVDTDYTYSGTADGKAYTITFNGRDVKQAINFDAHITLLPEHQADLDKIDSLAYNPFYIHFAHQGTFPGTAWVTVQTGEADGTYDLYYYNSSSGSAEFVQNANVKSGVVSFGANVGGDYFFTAKPLVKSTQSVTQSDLKKGEVPSGTFKDIMGKNVNLQIDCKTEDGTKYTLTFNGTDITKPMNFDTHISFTSKDDDAIKQLADPPYFVISFAHSGDLPGPMLVTLKTDLPDGEYLLFYYNPDTQKAEYVEKVTVKDGVAKFILKHCSDYFIAPRAKAASIPELLAQAEQAQQSAAAPTEKAPANTVVPAPATTNNETVQAAAQPLDQEQGLNMALIWVLAAVAAAAAVTGIVFYRKRKRKAQDQNGQVK